MHQSFVVTGMTCTHCERAVEKAICSVDASANVVIERTSGSVAVSTSQPRDALARAIAEQGYGVV
jgi:copper chaperone